MDVAITPRSLLPTPNDDNCFHLPPHPHHGTRSVSYWRSTDQIVARTKRFCHSNEDNIHIVTSPGIAEHIPVFIIVAASHPQEKIKWEESFYQWNAMILCHLISIKCQFITIDCNSFGYDSGHCRYIHCHLLSTFSSRFCLPNHRWEINWNR